MMKKMLKLLLILLFVSIKGFGQSNDSKAKFKGGDIELDAFLSKKFDQIRKGKKMDLCLVSVTFAKFTIDEYGHVKSIKFYQAAKTPPIFEEILKEVVNATDGQWLPETFNGKAVESRPFILPFIYQMEAGCSVNGKSVNYGTDNSLLELLKFDQDSTMRQLDCVLLKPLVAFSQN